MRGSGSEDGPDTLLQHQAQARRPIIRPWHGHVAVTDSPGHLDHPHQADDRSCRSFAAVPSVRKRAIPAASSRLGQAALDLLAQARAATGLRADRCR
jgi:hypothetical protein